ncbi:WD domain, G-beta repeat [Novymonas esmeraldas]|uniref:WD domain, G-beta repeat n=1 Tax=Novymonas esmeraldas TaxID=1808958 RepID=A0AAW0EM41_9TRYP
MGCVLSNAAADSVAASPSGSVPAGRHRKGELGSAHGSIAAADGGRPLSVAGAAAHRGGPSPADSDKADLVSSSGGEGRPPKMEDIAANINASSSSRRSSPAHGSSASETANPFSPMPVVRQHGAAARGSGGGAQQLRLHPQLAAAAGRSSVADCSPVAAANPTLGWPGTSPVTPAHTGSGMHLARPPAQPHVPRAGSLSISAELQHTRESLLSDISANLSAVSTTLHSSQDCNSPSMGNAGEGRSSVVNALFRNGDDLEAQRQQAPLSIEEDLFIYDDIIISKDEARTKHWRLAGRKPAPSVSVDAGGDSSGGAPVGGASGGGGGGGGAAGKKFFSFNDFGVCVDEMDLMPLTAPAAGAVAPLHRESLVKTNTEGLRGMTVSNRPTKAPNTVAHYLLQSRTSQAKADRPLRGFRATPLLGHATRVKCIALSPAEADFASCSNEDASITLSNLGVGSEVGIFTGHQDTIINATFSPDGKYLATTSKDKTMILWDVMTTKNLLTFAHPKVVICCCFGPDSKYLVSGCQDRVCRLWDTKRGREWLSYTGHEGIIIAIAFSPDGNYVCSASADKSLRVWSATTAKARFHLLGHVGIILSCSYSADGRHIISNDESLLRVWSAEDGTCKLSLSPVDIAGAAPPHHRAPKLGWTLSSAAPGAFTRYILVACNNRFVYVLDIETGREVTSAFCKAPVYCLTAGSFEKMACGDSFGNIYILSLT